MKRIPLLILILVISISGFGQGNKPTSQSTSNLGFNNYLAGVKYAEVFTTPEQEELMLNNPASARVYIGVTKYLSSMSFLDVGFSAKYRAEKLPSLCDKTAIFVEYEVNGSYINNLTLTFVSCDLEWWQFKSNSPISNNGWGNIEDKVYKACKKMYDPTNLYYRKDKRRKLLSANTVWTEKRLRGYFDRYDADLIEGIYEKTSDSQVMSRYKVGIIKEANEYLMVYLDGAFNYEDWMESEGIVQLTVSRFTNIFFFDLEK